MQEVTLKPFIHRGQESIGVYFANNKGIQDKVKRVHQSKWSNTHRCWYIPCTREACKMLMDALVDIASIDTSKLKQYLQNRKAVQPAMKPVLAAATARVIISFPLNEANAGALLAFRNLLTLKGYSPQTIKNYCNEFHQLLRLLNKTRVDDLQKEQLCSYLLWLIEKKGCSETRVHMAVNALKFYFEQVLGRDKQYYDLPRPKKPLKLPGVLAGEEVVALLGKVKNLKHKAMLMAGYAAGLRVSEIVRLKIGDIDSKRMMIHIHGAKGKKDRMVPLSKTLLEVLRIYYRAYQPVNFIFEGQFGDHYSERSVQAILQEAKKIAGISKKGSVHILRHSYATHLMECGTDIRIIQELLGHNNIKTTMLYTHVSKKDIGKIESPLDKLNW
jgi:site-specific recombinase XerD